MLKVGSEGAYNSCNEGQQCKMTSPSNTSITFVLNATQYSNHSTDTHDDGTLNIAVYCVLAGVSVLGSVGNLLILIAIAFNKRLQKRSNILIASLAVCDLLLCAYIMPLALVTSQADPDVMTRSTFCRINGFIGITCCYASIQTCMLIAIERYFHICRVVIYRKLFIPKYIVCVTAAVWIYALIWSIQGFTGWTRYHYSLHIRFCSVDFTRSVSYSLCVFTAVIALPLIVIVFCYLNIFRLVFKKRIVMKNHRHSVRRKQQEQISENKLKREYYRTLKQARKGKRETNVAFMLMIIVVLFILLWTPAGVVIVLNRFVAIDSIYYSICAWLALSNSAANSLVYGLLNRNFRATYVAMFRKLFCCQETATTAHDDHRAGWELSQLRARDQLHSSLNASQVIYRCTSPSSMGFGFMRTADDTSQTKLSETTDALLQSRDQPTSPNNNKFGKFLDIPLQTTKKPKTSPVLSDADFTSGYDTQRTLEFSSNVHVPVIQIVACTPSDETTASDAASRIQTPDAEPPKHGDSSLQPPKTTDTLSL